MSLCLIFYYYRQREWSAFSRRSRHSPTTHWNRLPFYRPLWKWNHLRLRGQQLRESVGHRNAKDLCNNGKSRWRWIGHLPPLWFHSGRSSMEQQQQLDNGLPYWKHECRCQLRLVLLGLLSIRHFSHVSFQKTFSLSGMCCRCVFRLHCESHTQLPLSAISAVMLLYLLSELVVALPVKLLWCERPEETQKRET